MLVKGKFTYDQLIVDGVNCKSQRKLNIKSLKEIKHISSSVNMNIPIMSEAIHLKLVSLSGREYNIYNVGGNLESYGDKYYSAIYINVDDDIDLSEKSWTIEPKTK